MNARPESQRSRLATIIQRGYVELRTSDEIAEMVMLEMYAMNRTNSGTPRVDDAEAALHISAEGRYISLARLARDLELENSHLRVTNDSMQRAYVRPDDLRARIETLESENAKLHADKARIDFLKEHTHFEFWVHHPNYDVHGGKRFNAEGIVFREVVDSAIHWQAKQTI